jgi:glutathione synthase/RimK-type ligase-like ATP-grasp enzyme
MPTNIHPLPMQDQSFEGHEWKLRRIFVTFINKAARELGIEVTWLSDHWIARLEKDGVVKYIHGSTFPLGSATSGVITRDKVSTFEVLQAAAVPAVPHYLVRFTPSRLPLEAAARAIRFSQFPMVVKPLKGFGGIDVVLTRSIEELNLQLTEFSMRYNAMAISPFLRIENEYRLIMLGREPLIIFEKVLSDDKRADEWRHNLKYEARPQVHSAPSICQPLTKLAQAAVEVLDSGFVSVDIVRVDGELQILEINGGVVLEHFSSYTPMYALQAFAAYKKALQTCFSVAAD